MSGLAYVAGGLVAIFLMEHANHFVGASAALLGLTVRNSDTVVPMNVVDRSRKRDRLTSPCLRTGQRSTAVVVETWPWGMAIVYGDHDAGALIRSDLISSAAFVPKDFAQTCDNNDGAVGPVPFEVIREPRRPTLPIGCESAFSVVATPGQPITISRCLAENAGMANLARGA
jgi:hypothetical protein